MREACERRYRQNMQQTRVYPGRSAGCDYHNRKLFVALMLVFSGNSDKVTATKTVSDPGILKSASTQFY